jgi:aryl-alcohol dehydrogenase-like predicted oxidoreductase
MARELGMGVTPWSPLRGGVLSGKYTRANRETVDPGRGDGIRDHLTDRNLSIVEKCAEIAAQVGATTAQVALAWVQGRPGVASTIIGARTPQQLEDNLGALDITLSPEHTAALDEASAIAPTFPQSFLPGTRTVVHGGTTIDGESREPWDLSPASDAERW